MNRSAISAACLTCLWLQTVTCVRAELPGNSSSSKKARVDPYGDPLPECAIARFGTLRYRAHSPVEQAILSNDGKWIALIGRGGPAQLIDATTGVTVRKLLIADAKLAGGAVAPDGSLLAVMDHSGTVYLHDLPSGKLRSVLSDDRVGANVTFSGDGRVLATTSHNLQGGKAFAWNVTSGRLLVSCTLLHETPIGVSVSSDGKTLATWGGSSTDASVDRAEATRPENTIQIWELPSGKETRRLHLQGAFGVSYATFSPDGRHVAVATNAGPVRMIELATAKEIRRFGEPVGRSHEEIPSQIQEALLKFSPDGLRLAAIGKCINIWEVATGKALIDRKCPKCNHRSLTFAGDRVVACGVFGQAFRVWDVSDGKQRGPAEGNAGSVSSMSFDSDGKKLLSADSVGIFCTWDVNSRREINKEEADVGSLGPLPACVSRTGRIVAVASPFSMADAVNIGGSFVKERELVRLYDGESQKEVRRLGGLDAKLETLAISPDARLVAAVCSLPDPPRKGHHRGVVVWDVKSGKLQTKFFLAEAYPLWRDLQPALVFSPNGRILASVDGKGAINLHEAASGKLLCLIPKLGEGKPAPMAFSPDGRVLAVGLSSFDCDSITQKKRINKIQLWELASRSVRWECTGHEGDTTALAFSEDGKLLASGGMDSTTLLWDITGRKLQPRLTAEKAEKLWHELASASAPRAYQALLSLTAAPPDAIAMLRAKLQPVEPAPDDKELRRLVSTLDSQRFAERDTAAAKLKEAGTAALPILREVSRKSDSPEQRQRAQKIMDEIEKPALLAPDVRSARALEVLENINSREAREIVRRLAHGRPDAWLTWNAKATLARMRPSL